MTLIELNSLTKKYPGVIANDDITFDIDKGEIHALLGENGAGKSTLVKMIYGLVQPDYGMMRLEGKGFTPAEPRTARLAGIAMVFQHFSLFEALSVAENIALGMESPPSSSDLSDRITKVSSKYGLSLDPKRLVGDLSVGERQRVEIIRCLLQDPKLLIMDEPTSVLTPQEVDALFLTLRRLRDEGTSILYISHKLEEIKSLCERATILRRGKVIGTCIPKDETAKSMAEMMVGSKLKSPKKSKANFGAPILEVNNLSLKSLDPFGTSLKDITFNLRAGEVMGVAGVAGNGQDEFMLALSGEILTSINSIKLEDKYIGQSNPVQRRLLGLLTAPEERLGHAAAPEMSLAENTLLSGFQRQKLGRRGFLNKPGAIAFAEKIVQQFDVRTPSVRNGARSLSGGNLQKFVIGREILQNPTVFVVNQPTWGVDAAAAAFIRQALLELAEGGAGVLVISQDLDELMEISDSFMVLSEGKISTPRPAKGMTTEAVGLMMGGESSMMRLEPRSDPSNIMIGLTPILAVLATMVFGGLLFVFLGKNPFDAIRMIFWDPVFGEHAFYYRGQILVKAAPLIMIALGLSFGFRAGIWNIGAEGQFIMGAVIGGATGLALYPLDSFIIFPLMILMGSIGGLLWALIPAFLKIRFNANEILVSLMLVYVAFNFLVGMVTGPLRNPDGFNFPESRSFQDFPAAHNPELWSGTGIHWGVLVTLGMVVFAYIAITRHIFGFNVRLAGQAPRAAKFAGVDPNKMIAICLGISGALAGMAGLFELTGPAGKLTTTFPVGYGFTAIIVAFLGRLHPIGILFAGLLLAITYVGGDIIQSQLSLPKASIQVFQGMLLFFLLAVDILVNFKIRVGKGVSK